MDVETPIGGRDRTKGFSHERRRMSCRGTPKELDLGGLFPFQWNIGLGRPGTSPMRSMTSSLLHGRFGIWRGQFGMCGSLENPKEG
jgi:hypothetical protein